MEEKYIVFIAGDKDLGGNYNVPGSFLGGLYRGMKKLYPYTLLVHEAAKMNIHIYSTIGCNILGEEAFDVTIKNNIPHLMLCDDTPFNLMTFIDKYARYENFFVATTSPLDIEPMKIFYPNMPVFYLPLAVEQEIWQADVIKDKEHDIVFLSSMIDLEETPQRIKENISGEMAALYNELYEFTYNNLEMGFWNIYKSFAQAGYCEVDNHRTYEYMLKNIVYQITFTKRVEMLRKLKDFKIKVYGNDLWKKYIEGNVEYIGPVTLRNSVDIIQNSRVVLNLQPIHLQYGLQERVLNPACAGSLVITDNNQEIKRHFADSMVYYDSQNFETLADQLAKYLANDKERINLAQKAQNIAIDNHTWDKRAEILLKNYFNLL